MPNTLAPEPTPTVSATTPGRLDVSQVRQFRRDGYTTFREPVLPPGEFTALAARFDELLDQQVKQGLRPEAMDKPHFVATDLFRWVFSDAVLDIVEPILGPDILLFSTHFICKPVGDGRRVPWHEDSAYWKGMLSPMEVVTVWLAIDPSTTLNGCMHVVPRSHITGKKGFSDYENIDAAKSVFGTEIVRPQQHADKAIPLELEPNQCSLHDARTIHGSPANTSTQRRCGYTMRFVPGHVRLSEKFEPAIRLYPARGHDRAGNNLADPTRTYPELYEGAKKIYKIH